MDNETQTIPKNESENISNPQISVAVCTYNRADRLVSALDALITQSLPTEKFEIILVDNASTDNTKEVCAKYQEKLSNLHYIYESVQGLSRARNTAINNARGKYISYLDDDAIPCEIWLAEILQTFEIVTPMPIGIGGPIYPLWEMGEPEWMQSEMDFLFSIIDYGKESHWLKFPKFPFGANMSYQREAILKVGGFDESLGRKGGSLLSCEEYLLNKTLTKQGGKFYYNSQASVQHWISKQRTDSNWLIRRSYWQGRSEGVVDKIVGKSLKRQWWDSFDKAMNLKRILDLWSPESKINISAKAWRARCWGYFFQVWFHHTLPSKKGE
ncbi:MAG: glycosyltransferase family 2 protein [Okeania sp. SIO2F4]|uniref:glycosyltransferase n=1 Tax=Okeania sp. SIO2F4 TaxID=2607790 RepID=UPI00142BC56F|nr:glycosyltransferase [Okeania sp. SIO2F4]NES02578.1 glycosyltransferase family 2 protein [Okeania sp. SIO2F4]